MQKPRGAIHAEWGKSIMTRRPGATLVEVLVSIFIMGIGLLALLTLFPIGILTMRQAILDDRTAHATANAVAVAEVASVRQDPNLINNPATNSDLFLNPNPTPQPGEALLQGPQSTPPLPMDGQSYAIYADPIGIRSYVPPFSNWVGGQTNGIRRQSVSFIDNLATPQLQAQALWRWFTSLDDIVFGLDGQPAPLTPGVFERGSVYSHGYLLRRPMTGTTSAVDMTVVVYQQRPLSLTNGAQAGETLYAAIFDPTSNVVSVTWGAAQPPPNVTIGGWILDTSPVLLDGQTQMYGPSHARFYRVVGYTQTTANTADLEVATQIQDFPLPAPQNPPQGWNAFTGSLVVMEGVAEVFPVGVGRRP